MGRKMSKREFIERYMADVARLYIVKRGKGGRCEFTKKQLEDICRRWMCGETIVSISKRYGCSEKVIRARLKELKRTG